MKAEIILDNSIKAREAIKILENKGIDQSSISISSPSRLQIERLLRLQNFDHQDLSLNTTTTVFAASGLFAMLALVAIVFTNGESSLLVKSLTIILAGSVGAFLSYVASQFRFSQFRKYNRIEITDEDSLSDKIALKFSLNENKKKDIEKILKNFNPAEVNFTA
jgi:hypothetical protein